MDEYPLQNAFIFYKFTMPPMYWMHLFFFVSKCLREEMAWGILVKWPDVLQWIVEHESVGI